MARYLVNRLCRAALFPPAHAQVRLQTTSPRPGDQLRGKDRGVASYVGMTSSFSSEMEACTIVPNGASLPVYQVLDTGGCIHDSDQLLMSNKEVLGLYKQMVFN